MFKWTTGNAQLETITLATNSITLNLNAASHFQNSHYVLVGYNDKGEVAIKPITKKDLDLNAYPKENLHKISLGKGYAKINNTALISLFEDTFSFKAQGQKIIAKFDSKENLLLFNLESIRKRGEEDGV